MIQRNKNFSALSPSYLFPEIARRRREYQALHPNSNVISLGVGNTTEPLPSYIASAMANYALSLATPEGYSGYGEDCGNEMLRQQIAKVFYNSKFSTDEIFISDGAKCDIARIQTLFGQDIDIALQDPSYPVYIDGSLLAGISKSRITFLPCTPSNSFFPTLSLIKPASLIYFCSPNNPTGIASSRKELTSLVDYANENGCIIIYDAAYSEFIRDINCPKSIYEIPGSRTCAIEINSFSKPAGFTGVRLGWSVVPKELKYKNGESVNTDWVRVQTTLFNCASNIAQVGGLAALSNEGLLAMKEVIDYYLTNASLIQEALNGENLRKLSLSVFYSSNSPYLWTHFPGKTSWEMFDYFLNTCHLVTTPGSGFGKSGEGFLRFSAFGHRENIIEACKRIKELQL